MTITSRPNTKEFRDGYDAIFGDDGSCAHVFVRRDFSYDYSCHNCSKTVSHAEYFLSYRKFLDNVRGRGL